MTTEKKSVRGWRKTVVPGKKTPILADSNVIALRLLYCSCFYND
jgi:hypothetical protein